MSPYSGKTTLPPSKSRTGHKFAWARLNADALFIALYALYVGVVGVMWPSGDIVELAGRVTLPHYLVHMAYGLGGSLLLIALAKQWVTAEILARVTLIWATGFQVFREANAFGWYPDALDALVICAIVSLTSLLRISILVSKKGIVVRLPERTNSGHRNPEDDQPDGQASRPRTDGRHDDFGRDA